jgi:hypothetical protein
MRVGKVADHSLMADIGQYFFYIWTATDQALPLCFWPTPEFLTNTIRTKLLI